MRRLATAVPTAAAAVVAVLTLTAGPALAHGPQATHETARHSAATKHEQHRPAKTLVTLTGVLSDTPTAAIAVLAPSSDTSTVGIAPAVSSDTATSTITVAVKGGERSLHRTVVVLTLDASTVVRRGDQPATAADLRRGDHVSVRARRMPDGTWRALRVNASPRED